MEKVSVMVSKQRLVNGQVYVSSNVALQMLGNLMSRKTLMKVAKEMNWQMAKIEGKYYFREADVCFPPWPATVAQTLIVTTLQAMNILQEDDVDYSYYGCKKVLKALGLANTEVVTVDGHEIAVAHMGDRLFGDSALLFGVFSDCCVFHEIALTSATLKSTDGLTLVSSSKRDSEILDGCKAVIDLYEKSDCPEEG